MFFERLAFYGVSILTQLITWAPTLASQCWGGSSQNELRGKSDGRQSGEVELGGAASTSLATYGASALVHDLTRAQLGSNVVYALPDSQRRRRSESNHSV